MVLLHDLENLDVVKETGVLSEEEVKQEIMLRFSLDILFKQEELYWKTMI